MVNSYSTRTFFRHCDNEYLQEYFDIKQIDIKMDFASTNNFNADEFHQHFKALNPDQQMQVELDFQAIYAMSNEGSIAMLFEIAKDMGIKLEGIFTKETPASNKFSNQALHDKALYVFNKHPKLFEEARKFAVQHTLSDRYWRKYRNCHKYNFFSFSEDKDSLSPAISRFFQKKEGRGLHRICMTKSSMNWIKIRAKYQRN